jgi:hypothetical protein
LERDPATDAYLFASWQQLYQIAGAKVPEIWARGLMRQEGHTFPLSDIFFLAHNLQMATVTLGVVTELQQNGSYVSDGSFISTDIIVKCIGYEHTHALENICGRLHTRRFGLADPHLWISTEINLSDVPPDMTLHCEPVVKGNPFVSSYLSVCQFQAEIIASYFESPDKALLHDCPPSARMTTFSSKDFSEGLQILYENNQGVRNHLVQHTHAKAADTRLTISLEMYLSSNKKAWTIIHSTLVLRAGEHRDPLPYVFSVVSERIKRDKYHPGNRPKHVDDAAAQSVVRRQVHWSTTPHPMLEHAQQDATNPRWTSALAGRLRNLISHHVV